MAIDIKFSEKVAGVLATNDSIDALDLLDELRQIEGNFTDAKTQQAMAKIKVQLTAVALQHFYLEDIEDLFEQSAHLIFPLDIDLKKNFNSFLMTLPFLEDKDEARQKCKEALERCTKRLTTPQLQLGTESVLGTVANWIKVYVSETGTIRANSVAVVRFFTKNTNIQKLNAREKAAVRRLIDFYDHTRLTSASDASFDGNLLYEDDNGIVWKLTAAGSKRLLTEDFLKEQRENYDAGKITRTKFQKYRRNFPEPVFDKYFQFKEDKVLSAREVQSHIQGFFNDQRLKYPSTVSAASKVPKTDLEQQAIFKKVTVSGKLEDLPLAVELFKAIVKDKTKFMAFMKSNPVQDFLQLKGQQFTSEKNKTILQQSPYGPLAFQSLLKSVFEGALSLSAEEATYRSYQVAQAFPLELRDYKILISYDVKQRRLVWRY